MKKLTALGCADKAILELIAFEEACEFAKVKLLKEIDGQIDGLLLCHLMGQGPSGRGGKCAGAILHNMRGAARTLGLCELAMQPPSKDAPVQLSRVRAAYAKCFLAMASSLHIVAKI